MEEKVVVEYSITAKAVAECESSIQVMTDTLIVRRVDLKTSLV